MPVDARIPLAATAPQMADPMQMVGQAMTLRNLGQRNQLFDAQIQREQAEAAQQQRIVADDEAINATIQQIAQTSGGRPNPEAVASALAQSGRGAAAERYMAFVSEGRKKHADARKAEFEQVGKQYALGSQIVSGVLDQDDASAARVWPQTRQQLAGVLGPEAAAQLPETFDRPTIANLHRQGLTAAEYALLVKSHLDQTEADFKTLDGQTKAFANALALSPSPEAWEQTWRDYEGPFQTDSRVLQRFPRQFSPEAHRQAQKLALTAKERADQAHDAATLAETTRSNKADEATARQRVAEQGAGVGGDMIAQAARNLVANPRDLTSLRSITSLRGEDRLKLFNEVKKLDPNYNVGAIERRIKFLDNYENPSGRAASNRQAMNNILMHAADLSDVNKLYRRTNVRLANTALNALARQHSDIYTQYEVPLTVLREEIALYFAGGYAPDEAQKRTWDGILNGTATPNQVEAFAKSIIHVGLRRASTHNSDFRSTMGFDDPNILTPDAVAAGKKLGLGGEVGKFGSGGEMFPRESGGATASPGAARSDVPDDVRTELGATAKTSGPGRYYVEEYKATFDVAADGTVTRFGGEAGTPAATPAKSAPTPAAAPDPRKDPMAFQPFSSHGRPMAPTTGSASAGAATASTPAAGAAQPAGTPDDGLVAMKAPNGQIKRVRPSEVAHYTSLGAVRVR